MNFSVFEELSSANFAWPHKGDKLNKIADVLSSTVAETRVHPDHLGVFSTGYRRAADTVIESVVAGREIANFLCWPVLLLYRHALELALKEAIMWSARALDEETGIKSSEHRLRVLVQILQKQSSRLFPNEDEEPLVAFSKLVGELDQLDPSGQSFRYPSDKEGNRFEFTTEYVDLAHIKVAMDKVLNFLDGYAGAASNLAEIAADMRAEYQADMYCG